MAKKRNPITITVDDENLKRIKDYAEKAGLSVSKFMEKSACEVGEYIVQTNQNQRLIPSLDEMDAMFRKQHPEWFENKS